MYRSASILAWGSESLFSRRMTIFAFDFGSESSASDCFVSVSGCGDGLEGILYLFIVDGRGKH